MEYYRLCLNGAIFAQLCYVSWSVIIYHRLYIQSDGYRVGVKT